MIRYTLALFLALSINNCLAQVNFKKDYLENNPVKGNNSLDNQEVIGLYESYLQEAVEHQDTLKQLYGIFYLFAEYYKTNDYVELKKLNLKAEKILDHNSKPEWQGAFRMRKAYMMEIVENDIFGAIDQYKEALTLCGVAKDTLCIAESLEQLSNLNKNLNNYEMAEQYFKEAVFLMEKFASPAGIALTYSNYSLLASDQGNYETAESYINKAISISDERQDTFNLVMYISNKASIYLKKERFSDAIEIYHEILPINKANGWSDNLLYNYAGLVNGYEYLGEFEKSNTYLQNYYELKDSLSGAAVQRKINDLEMKDQFSRNELVLKEKESQLQQSNQQRDRFIGMALLLGLSCIGLFCFWYSAKRNSKKEKEVHLNYIHDLIKILRVKNNEISALNEKSILFQPAVEAPNQAAALSESTNHEEHTEQDYKIFDARIINDEGITAFKSYFDKIYPGLLIRVRKQWATITDAEERLLMLIKLRIKSKEAAEILGISQSSVKKSRNRLRKRLVIDSSIDLEGFVQKIK